MRLNTCRFYFKAKTKKIDFVYRVYPLVMSSMIDQLEWIWIVELYVVQRSQVHSSTFCGCVLPLSTESPISQVGQR